MQTILRELADWAKGRLTTDDVNKPVTGLSTDSRTVQAGEAFLAIRGPRYDGHQYIAQAMERGAAVAIVSQEESLAGAKGLVVPDTLRALGDIAHGYRWSHPLIPWVAITGSNGKTTTREMVACILRSRGPVATPYANYNNLVGLPLSILHRTSEAWAGVLEIGASEPGEVARLTEISAPTVAIVTGTGSAHLEGFGSLETVAHEKGDIFERLPHDGVAIYPAHDPRVGILAAHIGGNRASFSATGPADMTADGIKPHGDGIKFLVRGVTFDIPLLGIHNVNNCLAALLAAEHLGIGLEEAAKALREIKAVQSRLVKVKTPSFTILDDVYNANPASLHAAVAVLETLEATRRVAVIGDMLELGTQSRELHREVGRELAQKKIDMILAVGKETVALAEAAQAANARITVQHYRTTTALRKGVQEKLRSGDAVLVKGSRGMMMEQIVELIKRINPEAPSRSTTILKRGRPL